jgi:hypothetical protein
VRSARPEIPERPQGAGTRRLAFAALASLTLLSGPASQAAKLPSPTPAALQVFSTLAGSRMGVDRAGRLWAWNRRSGRVAVLDPSGERAEGWSAADALVVDVDSEWGLVGLFHGSHELRWLRRGVPDVAIPLGGTAADVAWIGPATVAVTPQENEHRVEIWDLKERAMVASFGTEPPAPGGPGAPRLRAVLLRFDGETLYTLESFTGDLQVFSRDGHLKWRARHDDPSRASTEGTINEADRKAKADGERMPLTFFDFIPGVDSSGAVWVVDRDDAPAHSVSMVKLTAAGEELKTLSDEPCPSRSFVFWGDKILFYRDPAVGRGLCNSVRAWP